MRKVHVVVTEEDIKNGAPCCNEACPIALALKRQPDLNISSKKKLKEGERFIKVFTGCCEIRTIKVVSDGIMEETVETASNPPEVTNFIKAFDANLNRDKIKPFEFDLEFRKL